MPIRVLLADDHALLREGLRALLDRSPDIEVVGEAGNGREALSLARELSPDLVLLDVAMPEMSGLDALPRFARLNPAPAVILLSMHASESHIVAGIRAGAAGYLPKGAQYDEVLAAVRTVAAGGRYLPPSISGVVFDAIARSGPPGGELSDRMPLTPRQLEILTLIGAGHSNREIAARLHLSEKTIEAHRAQIRERLGIGDTAGLVRYAVRMGLVGPD